SPPLQRVRRPNARARPWPRAGHAAPARSDDPYLRLPHWAAMVAVAVRAWAGPSGGIAARVAWHGRRWDRFQTSPRSVPTTAGWSLARRASVSTWRLPPPRWRRAVPAVQMA